MRNDLYGLLKNKILEQQATGHETNLEKRLREYGRTMPPKLLDNICSQLVDTLPAAEKKYGKEHHNYLFYIDLVMVCIWCGRYMDELDSLKMRYNNLKLENEVLRRQLADAEKLASTYTTVHEIIETGSIDFYMKIVLENLTKYIPDHPRVKAFKAAMELLYPEPTQS